MAQAEFTLTKIGTKSVIAMSGDWTTLSLGNIEARLSGLGLISDKSVDLSRISSLDSAGAMIINNLKKEHNIAVYGLQKRHTHIFKLLFSHAKIASKPKPTPQKDTFIERLGKKTMDDATDILNYSEFLGALILRFLNIFKKDNFRLSSIVKQIELSSVNAIPIVALSSFLIGIVVTYQGAVQLEKFGAAIFTVDLLGLSITRELAPLLTAVVIAGRSGASYTSEIGVMKITEEIDAMRTMGFDPYYFLVIPRVLALTLTLWLVIFFADTVAIAGGMLISKLHLGISYSEFMNRLQSTLAMKHVFVGLAKAPFFAFLIASIGIFRGLQVSGSSESIGTMTTRSVVNSIFAVIACDAIFAVMFTRLGI